MLRMLRFRRYRLFLACAAIASLLLLRSSHQWDLLRDGDSRNSSPKYDSHRDSTLPLEDLEGNPKDSGKAAYLQVESSPASAKAASHTSPPTSPSVNEVLAPIPTLPHAVLPHRTKPGASRTDDGALMENIHPLDQPGRKDLPTISIASTTIHWEKQVEHFPLPTESLIQLPTGAPASIPNIQHDFKEETPDAKIKREERQAKVREEFLRAWIGYKEKAWLHDELSPVSGGFRDPFCGWAATLVDTLDTLWIMGLQEEFEEAARAVDLIDFTTSRRSDIPVFETTIRYLGGLLAAYDVSGGVYKNLLEKAEELADILMGAFDTPNRMPVLYYRWKPTFSSQPHRANQRSNTAELGSLALEFTRLAQLTKNPRYYDAIARITNALYEWQERGTQLDGVFPDNIDASGCNRSVQQSTHKPIANTHYIPPNPLKSVDPPKGFEPNAPKAVVEPKPQKKGIVGQGMTDLEMQIASPGPGQPSKATLIKWDDEKGGMKAQSKRDLGGDAKMSDSPTAQYQPPVANDAPVVDSEVSHLTTPKYSTDPITGLPINLSGARNALGDTLGDWDCKPQGLEAANPYSNKFSMGGGQDSTYEYFPKQYLLLGGREAKYRTMYLKTIDAVRKWMLYRPMIPGNPNILFSGAVTTKGDPETDLKFTGQVDHLTCFIGGMVGMGAKVFGLEGDLDLAMRLADGCVWAYEATPSGIMPEGAIVLPCESDEQCTWNETAYWESLDPMAATRDHNVEEYDKNKAIQDAEKARLAEAILTKADQDVLDAEKAAIIPTETQKEDVAKQAEEAMMSALADPTHTTEPAPTSHPVSLQKRQSLPEGEPEQVSRNFENSVALAKENYKKDPANGVGALNEVSSPPSAMMAQDKVYMEKALATEAELRNMAAGRQAQVPLPEQTPRVSAAAHGSLNTPTRPLTHKEFVENRIKQDSLPPGFVSIGSRKYILRPEAIESVWYMYRITGDPIWQEKGWKMFNAIIRMTSTQHGHSAIYDVLMSNPAKTDEMESFWLAETLKYFYLLYSTPDTISLDDWVLNTEAHPFKREG